jgi:hypothetical protein
MVEPRDMSGDEMIAEAGSYGADYVYVYNENYEWDCFKSDGTPVDILSNIALN